MGRGRQFVATVGLVAALVGIGEGLRALYYEWATHAPRWLGGGDPLFLPTLDRVFPWLVGTPFQDALQDDRLARSRWVEPNTRIEGLLSMPLGRRQIRILPDAPSAAMVAALRTAGVRWVLWDALLGPVPPAIRAEADQITTHPIFLERRLVVVHLRPGRPRTSTAPDS